MLSVLWSHLIVTYGRTLRWETDYIKPEHFVFTTPTNFIFSKLHDAKTAVVLILFKLTRWRTDLVVLGDGKMVL